MWIKQTSICYMEFMIIIQNSKITSELWEKVYKLTKVWVISCQTMFWVYSKINKKIKALPRKKTKIAEWANQNKLNYLIRSSHPAKLYKWFKNLIRVWKHLLRATIMPAAQKGEIQAATLLQAPPLQALHLQFQKVKYPMIMA